MKYSNVYTSSFSNLCMPLYGSLFGKETLYSETYSYNHPMSFTRVIIYTTRELLPIVGMIALIPLIRDDTILTILYGVIGYIRLWFFSVKHDRTIYTLGFLIMIILEAYFVSTGVEVFTRQSLLGIMPLWLPFLWAYSFLAMRRIIHLIERSDARTKKIL